jgi:hypothetical protein
MNPKALRIRIVHHPSEIPENCIRNGICFSGTLRLGKAFANGDNLRHLLSAIRGGLISRCKKVKQK